MYIYPGCAEMVPEKVSVNISTTDADTNEAENDQLDVRAVK